MSVHVDYAKQQGGFRRPAHGLNQERCPGCGAATLAGFGLMGGGFGGYVMCEECPWFYKEQTDGSHLKPRPPSGRQRTRALWRRRGRR